MSGKRYTKESEVKYTLFRKEFVMAEALKNMAIGEWVWNDENCRTIVIGNMYGGRYEMYEMHQFCGCTGNVEKAIAFLMAE